MAARPNSQPQHLSLQTKVATTIVVAMAISMLAATTVNYYLAQQFHRDSVYSDMEKLEFTLASIIQRRGTYLERITSQIKMPDTSSQGIELLSLDAPSLFSGIDSASIISSRGEVLLHWELPGVAAKLPEMLVKTITHDVLQNGLPINRLFCDTSCIHSVFIPQIDDDGKEVVINANLSLVDLFRDFKTITDSDIVFFNQHDWQQQDHHTDFMLLSSSPNNVTPLVEELTRTKAFQKNNFFLGELGGGYFAAKHIQLESPLAIGSIDVLLLTDESSAYAFIQQSFKNEAISSAITLIMASLILIFVLRMLIERIRFLSLTLPQLAQQEFSAVKANIDKARRRVHFRDEIFTLADAMGDTTDALEKLNSEVQQHRKSLEEKIHELQETQEFNQFLVDGSPLAIIVYREDGSVRSVNEYAKNICGPERCSAPDLRIDQLILPDDNDRPIDKVTELLKKGGRNRLQTEQPLYGQDGHNHTLNWVHTSLTIQNEQCFLSLGLDVTESRETEERMRWLSKHDYITNLLNRATFTDEADKRIELLGDDEPLSLLVMDISSFSTLNDRYGLQVGDQILEKTAQHIVNHLPPQALIARTGANEFSALLAVNASSSENTLEELTHFPFLHGQESIDISLTGVQLNYPEHGETIDELLANAAEALGKTKEKNPGTIYRVTDTLNSRVLRQEKLAMRDKLLHAFEDNRFVLFYQPIYHLESQSISHCECLIRLLDDDGSFVSPGLFLNVAREFGLMSQLDHHVLEMAMKQQARWKSEGLDIKVSINVTPSTFQTKNFQSEMQKLIQETGAQGDHLIFEIVETEALENISFAQTIAEELTSIGAQLAFDDFGIGFTSFEYLRELPVDYVKIDQSFIRYLDQREKDQLLVKSMVEMSLALDKKVIAEGVESREAWDILANMGVQYLQGYYLARPAPASEIDFSRKFS